MKKQVVTLLAAVMMLVLLMGVAVAATRLWGVQDFADRFGEPLPTVPVQEAIPQSGGDGSEMTVAATSSVWDGETVRMTLHCQPKAENLLLMEACLQLDMPVRNLDRDLPEGGTIADWIAQAGFTDVLGVAIEPMLNGAYMPYRVAWHLEEDGSYTLYYEFDGVADGPLDVRFQCVTWGWDAARESFCDDARNEVFDLHCTLTPPEAP
ncbi:MAG: hypothetical protein IJE07_12995 [Clostridia bacterium]|nr:hypothetical protein [Clostridia bacterium]